MMSAAASSSESSLSLPLSSSSSSSPPPSSSPAPSSSPPPTTPAEEHKSSGNKLFAEHHFAKAIAEYTKAIELDGSNPIFYSNRSICYVRLESYGAAIEDATAALKLDADFIKAYYRRGAALVGLQKYKEALSDFKQVVKRKPSDKDGQTKLQLCQAAIREAAFRSAIETEHSKPPSEFMTFKDIDVDDSYDGPRLNDDSVVDLKFVTQLSEHFRAQKKLHRRYVYQIVLQIIDLLKKLPTLVDVEIPADSKLTVCGDVHGQYFDVLNIFEINGVPSSSNPYLFNGDFVDRGSFSVEVILLFFSYKLLYPNHFHLTRGNHESNNMNSQYGFQGEVNAKVDAKAFSLFSEAFEWLPLAYLLNKKVLVLHGGLFSKDGVTIEDVRKIQRARQPPDEGVMCELLWSDPQPRAGRSPSKRGVGLSFGPDVTKRFLDANNLSLLVRSHEVKEEGYEVEADGRLITIFSAPNYCDQMGNKGAFITFQQDCVPKFTQFSAVSHPKVACMAYASPMMRNAFMG